MKASILVTGGAGFVGSHFARAAAEAGMRVTVLDDLSAGTTPPTDGIELVVGDIADQALVATTIREREITAYAHFAGKICVAESVEKPAKYFEENLVKTIALLDVVREHAPAAFLFSSTAAVYGVPDVVPIPEDARTEPINPYGDSKLAVERVLAAYGRAYGVPWAALRYFNAAGAHPDGTLREAHEPETHLIPLAIDAALGRRGPLTVFGDDYPTRDGTCVRDYVHVCDLRERAPRRDRSARGRPPGRRGQPRKLDRIHDKRGPRRGISRGRQTDPALDRRTARRRSRDVAREQRTRRSDPRLAPAAQRLSAS